MGAVHFAQAKYELAMAQYERSLQLYQEIENKAGIAWTVVHMGLVHQAEGRLNDAHAAYEKCRAIVEGLNDKASIAVALALLARTGAALDRPHEALAVARQAAAVAAEIGELDTLARARLVAGEIEVQLDEPGQAQQAFADAAAALEKLQMQGAGAERDRFFGDTLAPFLGLVRLSVTGGKPDDALAWLERGKAYLLRNVIGGSGAIVTKGMTDAERADERRLARRLVSLTAQVRRERGREAPDQARLERLQADLEQTRVEQAAFATALYEAHPALKTLRAQGDPVSSGGKAGLPLSVSSAVLEFAVSEQNTYLFVIKAVRPSARSAGSPQATSGRADLTPTPEGAALAGVSVNVHVLDVRAVDLASKIAQFRQLITRKGAGADAAARELYDLLLKPAEAEFAGATRVIVVPDAVTWALPFQALQPKDGRYLIEDRAVSYAASLRPFVGMSGSSGPSALSTADSHVRGRLAWRPRLTAGVSAPGCENRRRAEARRQRR
jgi:tetratricopeptide (TPR) repeat protein